MKPKTNASDTQALIFDVIVLLLANLLTVVFFFHGKHSVLQVLLTYYIQTVLIAVFYYARIKSINNMYLDKVWKGSRYIQDKLASYISASSEFMYLVVFLAPLAYLFYKFASSIFDGSTEPYAQINYVSVLIGASLFLVHHITAYFLDVRSYYRDTSELVRVPYVKLAIRVATIVAVTFIGFSLFQNNDNHLFVVFMLIKTFVDIGLSSSFVLLRHHA